MKLVLLILIGFISACAATKSDNQQNITVMTSDVEGAQCSLTDSKGSVWSVESTPGSTLVQKGDGPISVICKKNGYSAGVGELKVDVAMAGNPIRFLINGMTGTGEKYNSSIDVEMEPLAKPGERKPWE